MFVYGDATQTRARSEKHLARAEITGIINANRVTRVKHCPAQKVEPLLGARCHDKGLWINVSLPMQ